jgi:leucyl aminopeptidase
LLHIRLIKEAGSTFTDREIATAADLALSMNIARHYTNLPPGDLNPRTYAESLVNLFSKSEAVAVEVWEGDKLVEERMNMLIAVGQASNEGPRFVHMRYRPKKASGEKPIALVGKGITFDSGGLDIKPSSGMRWMKKDMGGSAAVVGLVKWAERTEYPHPIDAYVSLAENSVGSRAFRPGDVLKARNGMTVEISNTDAEGRLVLADALDVAVSQEGVDKPSAVINIATLTGAIKVALGTDIAGLFSNSDHLASVLFDAGLSRGDLMWRMPLFQAYRSQLKSSFADCLNCSEGGFAGAITAALFLESFVKGIPWAHLDIFAWKDSPTGAWAEMGGSAQSVQALSEALTRLAAETAGEELA